MPSGHHNHTYSLHPHPRHTNFPNNVQTSSIGERVSGLVTRHAVLLARLASVSSRTSDAAMSPELNEGLAALLAACLTPLGSRDRLLSEQVILMYEHRACSFLAKTDAAAALLSPAASPTSGPSPRTTTGAVAAAALSATHPAQAVASHTGVGGEVRGSWAAAARALAASRDPQGLLLYGRTAALLVGGSSSWAAVLHTPQDDAAEPAAATAPGPAVTKKPPAPAPAKVKGTDATAALFSPDAGTAPAAATAMDASRAAWRHPLELWGSFDSDAIDATSGPNGWRTHQACCWASTGRVAAGFPVCGVGRTVLSDADDEAGAGVGGGKPGEKVPGKGAAGGASVRTRSARSARMDAEGGVELQKIAVVELYRLPTTATVAGTSVEPVVTAAFSSASWEHGLGPSHRSLGLSFMLEGCYDDTLVDALIALGSNATPGAASEEGFSVDDAVNVDAAPGTAVATAATLSKADFVPGAIHGFQGTLAFSLCRGFARHLLALVSPLRASSTATTAGEKRGLA